MILFLNFAPIQFMGGVEKWITGVMNEVNKKEKVVVVCVNSQISNIYSKLVLKRTFEDRTNGGNADILNSVQFLTLKSFIPFSKEWHNIRGLFRKARIIYFKVEVIETVLALYFGGLKVLRGKVVGGLHSPLVYNYSQSFFDILHDLVYKNYFFGKLMGLFHKIHVLNKRDLLFLRKKFKLSNVSYVPNGTNVSKLFKPMSNDSNTLKIVFVGELSYRKGIDILEEVISKSPLYFEFHIAGDGEHRDRIENLASIHKNCYYYGYIGDKLDDLYKESDVLFFPSRAETFGLVLIEAMMHGLKLVANEAVSLQLPDFIENCSPHNDPEEYIQIFEKLRYEKLMGVNDRAKIHRYCQDNFSYKVIYPQLFNSILEVH